MVLSYPSLRSERWVGERTWERGWFIDTAVYNAKEDAQNKRTRGGSAYRTPTLHGLGFFRVFFTFAFFCSKKKFLKKFSRNYDVPRGSWMYLIVRFFIFVYA